MNDPSELREHERKLRRVNLLTAKAESGGEDLTRADITELREFVADNRVESYELTRSALQALNAVAKERPELLDEILPDLIQSRLHLPQSVDADGYAAEEVSTDPEIGVPVHTSWIVHNAAARRPELFSEHAEVLAKVYDRDGTLPHEFVLALGRLAVTGLPHLPRDRIRSELEELSRRDGYFGTEAADILIGLD